MKAVICSQYGDPSVLQVKEWNKPTPNEDEVLVKIHATSVTAAHCLMRTGKPYIGRLFIGVTKPKMPIPGTDLAGVVLATGKNVKKFSVGDEVFAATDLKNSAYAEYICVSENEVIAKKPTNMSFAEATAIIDGATTALVFLRDVAKINTGKKILINGASGGIGTAAVQLAKYYGAEVTGVCSTANVEMVKSLGADKVIDYMKEDFTLNGLSYDVIFDTVGKIRFSNCKRSLSENGLFLSPVLSLSVLFHVFLTAFTGEKKVKFSATGLRRPDEKLSDLIFLKDLIEKGNLKSVIDRTYTLEQVVEAHCYVEKGHKRGNVVISLSEA